MEALSTAEIVFQIVQRIMPALVGLVIIIAVSVAFKRHLSLYGRLFDSPIGIIGFSLVVFWVLCAFMPGWIAPFDPAVQNVAMSWAEPGSIDPDTGEPFLLGGDKLGRDIFSRVVYGAQVVLRIAPAATLFAFMMGILLGLPSGFFGGMLDTVLSFIANLVLAFPVILLFFLLVTPEIAREDLVSIPLFGWTLGLTLPQMFAAVLFLFPIFFLLVLFSSRYITEPERLIVFLSITLIVGFWIYSGLVFNADPTGIWSGLMDPNMLNIFVSVVFVNSPTVFRIVRGITMDIKTRDYVAAAQTRGESPWYIMLWEILPNARGPLIVDFCLRIGYVTILLGTLGFFGLGVSSESADWGLTISDNRQTFLLAGVEARSHTILAALSPAIALMTLVLGLNLLADGLREQSLKD